MSHPLIWANRPKWHRFETPQSYARRLCRAAGVPLDFVERRLTTSSQPYIYRVWARQDLAAATIEAAAGRPSGHFDRMLAITQPDRTFPYPNRVLCRLCSRGELVEQIPHDSETWCLRHPGQLVWTGAGTTLDTQLIAPFSGAQRIAELSFRRMMGSGRVNARLHSEVWAMVRDSFSLAQIADTAYTPTASGGEVNVRARLFPITVKLLRLLSEPATIELWRTAEPTSLRAHISASLPELTFPAAGLVERIVLWLRPLRRVSVPTRVDPLDVPLDVIDAAAIIDVRQAYPAWVRQHPRAVSEWDWDKNDPGRSPWDFVGVSRKAWWVCDKGHSWETKPSTRGAAVSQCPVCSRQAVWPGHTDLRTLHPAIADEWDCTPGANIGDPDRASASSSRRVAWICSNGHRWVASISNRTNHGSGCPYCSKGGRRLRALAGQTDLATLRPDLAREWDQERNGPDVSPANVRPGSGKHAWWLGACGHSWRAVIASRSGPHGRGCPFCANKAVLPGFNDLATTHPHLRASWSTTNQRGPEEVTAGSSFEAVWRCERGHEWKQTVQARAVRGTGCPYCGNVVVLAGLNDLATVNPELAAEWDSDPGANTKSPTQVLGRSGHRARWRCSKGHRWTATVANRGAGHGCPYCAGRRVIPAATDLASRRPDLVSEWGPRNTVAPSEVAPYSHRKYGWVCSRGHDFSASPANRSNGFGCPYCAGQRPWRGETDLATLGRVRLSGGLSLRCDDQLSLV